MTDDTTTMVELHGGPLDGQTVPVDIDPTDPDPWTAIINDGTDQGGH